MSTLNKIYPWFALPIGSTAYGLGNSLLVINRNNFVHDMGFLMGSIQYLEVAVAGGAGGTALGVIGFTTAALLSKKPRFIAKTSTIYTAIAGAVFGTAMACNLASYGIRELNRNFMANAASVAASTSALSRPAIVEIPHNVPAQTLTRL